MPGQLQAATAEAARQGRPDPAEGIALAARVCRFLARPENSNCYHSVGRCLVSPGTLRTVSWPGHHPKVPMRVESSDQGAGHDSAPGNSGGEQRGCHQRLTGQRGVRRVQGHPAVHRGIRPGGVAPCRAGHYRHGGDAQDDSVRRRGQAGSSGVRGPRRRAQSEEAYLKQLGELLTPDMAGSALVDLVRAGPATTAPGYLLTAAGLQKLP
jgi:hypothetical protein